MEGTAPLKADGNALFVAKRFGEAAEKYTEALAKARHAVPRVPIEPISARTQTWEARMHTHARTRAHEDIRTHTTQRIATRTR